MATKDSISWIMVNSSLKLTTRNLTRGNKFYNEKIVFSNDQEYRVWKPYKSKLAAAILNGLEILPIIEKSRMLYLSTSEIMTLSHISDIIGTEGVVYVVEHSQENAKELIEKLVQKRDNIKPIIMDMKKPLQYEIIDGKVDVVYVDVEQFNQEEIALLNCKMYLQVGGYLLLMAKTRSVDEYQGKKFILNYKSELINTMEENKPENYATIANLKVNFEIIQQINLADFFKDYSLVVAKYLG
jgi:fibrillarin-like pre-rRNA processing protein